MRKLILVLPRLEEKIHFVAGALFGCALITLASCIRMDSYPVPFTLQTMAIFVLGLWQSPKKAASSAVCYLVCATLGLPVLGGKVNPFWILGPTGGYLIGFPFAAFLLAFFRERRALVLGFTLAQGVIWLLGWLWLSFFLGPQAAFCHGVAIFFLSALYKVLASFFLYQGRRLWFP